MGLPDTQIGIFCGAGDADMWRDNLRWPQPPAELNPDTEAVIFVPTLLHPLSRGEVRLRSTDPLAPPKICPNYLDDPRDIQRLTRACQPRQGGFCGQLPQGPWCDVACSCRVGVSSSDCVQLFCGSGQTTWTASDSDSNRISTKVMSLHFWLHLLWEGRPLTCRRERRKGDRKRRGRRS